MSDTIKVSMTQEDVNEAFKWSRDAIAAQASEIERLREASEKALHILQYCPDKQEKVVALLIAALQPKENDIDA